MRTEESGTRIKKEKYCRLKFRLLAKKIAREQNREVELKETPETVLKVDWILDAFEIALGWAIALPWAISKASKIQSTFGTKNGVSFQYNLSVLCRDNL